MKAENDALQFKFEVPSWGVKAALLAPIFLMSIIVFFCVKSTWQENSMIHYIDDNYSMRITIYILFASMITVAALVFQRRNVYKPKIIVSHDMLLLPAQFRKKHTQIRFSEITKLEREQDGDSLCLVIQTEKKKYRLLCAWFESENAMQSLEAELLRRIQ